MTMIIDDPYHTMWDIDGYSQIDASDLFMKTTHFPVWFPSQRLRKDT